MDARLKGLKNIERLPEPPTDIEMRGITKPRMEAALIALNPNNQNEQLKTTSRIPK